METIVAQRKNRGFRLKVFSDGMPDCEYNTGIQIVNANTGEKLEGVKSVSWRANGEELAVLTLELVCFEMACIGAVGGEGYANDEFSAADDRIALACESAKIPNPTFPIPNCLPSN